MKKVLGISGSIRKNSLNKKLLYNCEIISKDLELDYSYLDLSKYPLPIYNGDLENEIGSPNGLEELKAKLDEADSFIFASPEYNSGISPLLKNTIDWCSRVTNKGEKHLSCFRGKYALTMSATPGKLGGLRGLYHLRYLLENIHITAIAEMLAFSGADKIFDSEDHLISEKDSNRLRSALIRLKEIKSVR